MLLWNKNPRNLCTLYPFRERPILSCHVFFGHNFFWQMFSNHNFWEQSIMKHGIDMDPDITWFNGRNKFHIRKFLDWMIVMKTVQSFDLHVCVLLVHELSHCHLRWKAIMGFYPPMASIAKSCWSFFLKTQSGKNMRRKSKTIGIGMRCNQQRTFCTGASSLFVEGRPGGSSIPFGIMLPTITAPLLLLLPCFSAEVGYY